MNLSAYCALPNLVKHGLHVCPSGHRIQNIFSACRAVIGWCWGGGPSHCSSDTASWAPLAATPHHTSPPPAIIFLPTFVCVQTNILWLHEIVQSLLPSTIKKPAKRPAKRVFRQSGPHMWSVTPPPTTSGHSVLDNKGVSFCARDSSPLISEGWMEAGAH